MINELLRAGLENEQSAHDLVDIASDAAGWFRGTHAGDRLRKAAHQNMEVVFQCTCTPVEQRFFGAVAVLSVTGQGLVVVHPAETLADFYAFRRQCREFYRLRNAFHFENGKDDFVTFMHWL